MRRGISSVIIKWDTEKRGQLPAHSGGIAVNVMKKLAGFIILAAIFLAAFSLCSAESRVKLYWDGNAYAIDEAAASVNVLPFKVVKEDGVTHLSDEAAGIDAAVRVDTLDEEAFQALRDYYNDKKSTKDQLFEKFVKLRRSYLPAAQDLFRACFLYGEEDNAASESNFKLFYDGTETIYGLKSAVYLYNVFTSDRLEFNEETHLDLSIPSAENYSVISIGITVKSGSLNESTISKITELLCAIRPEGLSPQTGRLMIFDDKKVLDAVNEGIYPAPPAEGGQLLKLEDAKAGFGLSYPSSYVPYFQNSLGGRIQYWSFKIDPNNIFSISAASLEPGDSPESAVKSVVALEGMDFVSEEGKQEIKGRAFNYIKYQTVTTEGAIYVSDYFTSDNSKLYRLQLSSRFEKPSTRMLEDFGRILESLSTQKPLNSWPADAVVSERYINKEEGYGFSYPKDWQLTYVSDDIRYDRLKLIYPGLSGPLDITFSEGELFKETGPLDLPSVLTGKSRKSADVNVKSYNQPFNGRPVKLLSRSYRVEGSAIYSYRLLDYLDTNGRNRLAYCIDIIKGKKIYSMFITIGEYETVDGRIKDEGVNAIIDAIASSFRIEDTVEAQARGAAGETRNRNVVFIEEWLKKNTDPKSKITEVEKTAADGSIYVKVASGESGYYRVRPDFENGGLQILDRTLTLTILESELEKLKAAYKDRIVTRTEIDEATMTIAIDSQADKSSPVMRRTYRVDAGYDGNRIKWETVRANHAEELRKECWKYLSFIFSADVNIQFEQADAFKDIESYMKSNMMYHTMVHLQFNNIDGFFVLEIDPSNDNIRPVTFKPMDLLLKEIDESYGYGRSGFEITDSSFDGNSFILRLTMKSKADGALKAEDVKILYNKGDMTVGYMKLY